MPHYQFVKNKRSDRIWWAYDPETIGEWRFSFDKVKITVLKTTLDKDLAAEYGAEGLTACPMLR